MPKSKKRVSGLTAARERLWPTKKELTVIGNRVMTLDSVRKYIGCGNVRRLYVETLDDEVKGMEPRPPGRFCVALYDEANHRTILIDGSLADPRHVNITESSSPPAVRPKRVGNGECRGRT
jgi:hypothetical protein